MSFLQMQFVDFWLVIFGFFFGGFALAFLIFKIKSDASHKELTNVYTSSAAWFRIAVELQAEILREKYGTLAENQWRDFARYNPPDLIAKVLLNEKKEDQEVN
jgi:hypothetical protein